VRCGPSYKTVWLPESIAERFGVGELHDLRKTCLLTQGGSVSRLPGTRAAARECAGEWRLHAIPRTGVMKEVMEDRNYG
jgi:hypothetical protein